MEAINSLLYCRIIAKNNHFNCFYNPFVSFCHRRTRMPLFHTAWVLSAFILPA